MEKYHYLYLRDLLQFCREGVLFLGIKIDSKLKFENHIKVICSKASQKLGAY